MTSIRIGLILAGLSFAGCKSPEQAPPAPSTAVEQAPSKPPPSGAEPVKQKRIGFDTDTLDAAPSGFAFERSGKGALGRWVVRAEGDAPSPPNVLAQLDNDDTDFRFPVAVLEGVSLQDVHISARCKAISGKVDQACGIVFRYRDANNYYITRANALEGNIRLYYVKDGERHQLASSSGEVKVNAWHAYTVDARGDHIQVHWDGKQVLDHHDGTFSEAGRVGLWTKADSVAYFDDLVVGPSEQ